MGLFLIHNHWDVFNNVLPRVVDPSWVGADTTTYLGKTGSNINYITYINIGHSDINMSHSELV